MRHVGRQVHADPRPHHGCHGLCLHRLEVALLAVDVAVELAVARDRVVVEGRDAHVLLALDLEQKAVLDVEVHRRGRGRAGDEQVSGAAGHAALAVLDELLDLIEAVVDQLRVLRHLLDVAQRDPDAGALDVADRLRRRALSDLDIPEPGVREGQVALLAAHGIGRQSVGEFRNGIGGEKRMIDQVVVYRDRPARERIRECGRVDVDNPCRAQRVPPCASVTSIR